MFTGIVEVMAEIRANTDSKLVLERPSVFDDVRIGSSICVSGVCLTVSALTDGEMTFDVVPETLKKTKMGTLAPGDHVNLERALKVGDRFEGHVVQGHVEAVGKLKIKNVKCPPGQCPDRTGKMYTFMIPAMLLPYIVPQGAIAIDGVSLTVAKLEGNEVTVALIPHTIKNTTLGVLKEVDKVNVETDIFARYSFGNDEQAHRHCSLHLL